MSEMRSSREKILDEKRNVTARISETCRYIGFSLLAVYYAVLIGNAPPLIAGCPHKIIGLCGALIIALDYLQFLLGAWSVEQALASPDLKYPKTWAHAGRNWCFYLKQVTAGIGAITLIFYVSAASSQNAMPSV